MQKPKLKIQKEENKKSSKKASVTTSENKSTSSQEPTTMEELLSQTGYTLTGWKRGQVIEGKVLSVSPKHMSLDICGKSEAVIHEKEMPYIADLVRGLKVGDKVMVHVVNPENDRGQTVVSLRRTAMQKRWDMLGDLLKKSEAVEVAIRESTKGGFLVDYLGLRGFIPLSQADSELVRTGERASGRRVKVKVIEVNKDANRLVFSQTAGGMSDKQKEALGKVEIGKTYRADVTGLAPFGAFVTVKIMPDMALSGLIHISEIAWEKVEKPESYVKVGQTVDVKAIGVDTNTGKLTLSLKQLTPDPWQDIAKMFALEQMVKGKVTRLTAYGAFVTLLPGIEGLIHISKIPPGEEPKVGQDVECSVEEVSAEKHKISLSLVTHAKPIGYR